MSVIDRILSAVYGSKYLEFQFIDMFLSAFEDGQPRTNLPNVTGELVWTQSRVIQYLIENKLLEAFGNGYVITATGKMFLAKGGCRSDFMRHKLNRLSFILSLFASVVSIIAMIVAFCK